jgi:hypothetical protein
MDMVIGERHKERERERKRSKGHKEARRLETKVWSCLPNEVGVEMEESNTELGRMV